MPGCRTAASSMIAAVREYNNRKEGSTNKECNIMVYSSRKSGWQITETVLATNRSCPCNRGASVHRYCDAQED